MNAPHWDRISRLVKEKELARAAAAEAAAEASRKKQTKGKKVDIEEDEEMYDGDEMDHSGRNHPAYTTTRGKRKRQRPNVPDDDEDDDEDEDDGDEPQPPPTRVKKSAAKASKLQKQAALQLERVRHRTNPLFDQYPTPVDRSVIHVKNFDKYLDYIPREERPHAFNYIDDDTVMHMGNIGREVVTTTSPLYGTLDEIEREEADKLKPALGKLIKSRDKSELRSVFKSHPEATDWILGLTKKFQKKAV